MSDSVLLRTEHPLTVPSLVRFISGKLVRKGSAPREVNPANKNHRTHTSSGDNWITTSLSNEWWETNINYYYYFVVTSKKIVITRHNLKGRYFAIFRWIIGAKLLPLLDLFDLVAFCNLWSKRFSVASEKNNSSPAGSSIPLPYRIRWPRGIAGQL